MRTGLFFGTFDPIHNGHILKAVEVLERKLADKVVFVPAKQNPWKPKPMFDYEQRLRMCIFAAGILSEEMGVDNGKIAADGIEGRMEGPTFTYDVLLKYSEEHPSEDVCLVCGADVVSDIPKWKDGDKLLSRFDVISLSRGNVGERVYPDLDISSTAIRELLSKGMSVVGLVPHRIWWWLRQWIENGEIYGKSYDDDEEE